MKKTSKDRIQRTMTLSEALDDRLRERAAKLRIPISHLAERAIALFLANEETEPEIEVIQ